ncbi:hypothetical protein FE782_03690 [Paenibacillus antri]|uniref:Sigma-70 family RNA polymerase sigma factor n=1 Tax=Paenibacillus antri TaxID=2582848 RepID=A0A5R9GIU7_9BACL|nr:hypothetical protein [Paenibacillus antri]TLS53384.1 hypothetical protein FE782_03690 [Paenibacillus antri]
MSIIPSKRGKEAADRLSKRIYFDERRTDVGWAWYHYYWGVRGRYDKNEANPFRYDFDELSRQTDAFVRREAGKWARMCRKYRLYEDDFESHFRLTVAKTALRYKGEQESFFDYLRISIRNAGRDLVRDALRKKNRINHLALSLDDEEIAAKVEAQTTGRSAEDEAVTSILIAELAGEPSLNDQERMLFDFLCEDPDATLQDMADAIGVRDRKQASRVRQRLANKLRKYIE